MPVSNKKKRAKKLGIIAEELNDVEVLEALAAKIVPRNSFALDWFVGHGCAKVRNKCRVWTDNLIASGCSHVIVAHDLDRRTAEELTTHFKSELYGVPPSKYVIVIPIEEIEAWLLTDISAIKAVFRLRSTPRLPNHPEGTKSPKEYLEQLIEKHSNATYLNTAHNKKIAANLTLSALDKCPSFEPFKEFIKKLK